MNFDKVSIKATKRWTDESGKKRQQTREFYQTINPFNITKDGVMKTREQIQIEIVAERDEWLRLKGTE